MGVKEMYKEQLIGKSREDRRTVTPLDTARIMGSGDLDVYATPAMVAFMEYTAKELIKVALKDSETTVGVRMDVRHLKPTRIDMEIRSEATVTKVDDKKITLKVDVFEGELLIGTSIHERFIVDKKTFLDKSIKKEMEG